VPPMVHLNPPVDSTEDGRLCLWKAPQFKVHFWTEIAPCTIHTFRDTMYLPTSSLRSFASTPTRT
jgi:hypothetical protein